MVPFDTEIDPNAKEAEELAELKVLNVMKLGFNNKTDHSSFWLPLHDSHPLLRKKTSANSRSIRSYLSLRNWIF